MKRLAIALMTTLCVSEIAQAHVTVSPQESKAGASERYTVRVPTEGKVATTSVVLDVPDGVTVSGVLATGGWTQELKRDANNRIVAITWTLEIKPGEFGEFVFTARNPKEGAQIIWKAHQKYADGTSSAWVSEPGERSPAPITKLTPASR